MSSALTPPRGPSCISTGGRLFVPCPCCSITGPQALDPGELVFTAALDDAVGVVAILFLCGRRRAERPEMTARSCAGAGAS